jgi:hypothetical protein
MNNEFTEDKQAVLVVMRFFASLALMCMNVGRFNQVSSKNTILISS